MPIPLPPRHYRCPACGWSKTVVPDSDVLMPGHNYFSACPKCGHAPLSSQEQPYLSTGVGQIANMLKRWLKR